MPLMDKGAFLDGGIYFAKKREHVLTSQSSQRKFTLEETDLIGNLGYFPNKWSVKNRIQSPNDLCQAILKTCRDDLLSPK
jgi:hypothetical protein